MDLLERHKAECKGLLKRPTKTELPKEGENKVSLTNYHKQMKAPFVIYADFESLIRKVRGCDRQRTKEESFTVKTEMHEACGFSYIIARSDGKTFGPSTHRGKDAVYVFLANILEDERRMRADMEKKKLLLITPEDWK